MRDFEVATVWRMNFVARLHLKLFLDIVLLVADELQDKVHASGNLLVENHFSVQLLGRRNASAADAARHSFFESGTSRSQAPYSKQRV